MTVPKKYISIRQQKILMMLLKNNKVNFSLQNLYKNRRIFNKNMNELLDVGWLYKKQIRLNGHYANEYGLTTEGIIISKAVFLSFYESNN